MPRGLNAVCRALWFMDPSVSGAFLTRGADESIDPTTQFAERDQRAAAPAHVQPQGLGGANYLLLLGTLARRSVVFTRTCVLRSYDPTDSGTGVSVGA